MSRDLPASAEVVVVGGGAVGSATAFYLTELGVHDVVLIERETLGSGSTGRSAGGIRLQFADELNIRIALRALPVFESFSERFDVDIEFIQAGYLFLLSREADLAQFRQALALQASLGVPSRELDTEEATALVPLARRASLEATPALSPASRRSCGDKNALALSSDCLESRGPTGHARGLRIRRDTGHERDQRRSRAQVFLGSRAARRRSDDGANSFRPAVRRVH